jgi:hypothetical protein
MVGQALRRWRSHHDADLPDREPLSEVVSPHIFGSRQFLLTFVMLWAYLEFSQF